MAASRRDLFKRLHGLEVEMDHLFNHLMATRSYLGVLTDYVWYPPTDIFETEEAFVVCMEIPGVEKDDIEIAWDENVLIIRGRRVDRCREPKVAVHQMEISYGHFHRRIELPFRLSDDSVSDARLVSGFLRLRIIKPR